MKYKYYNTFPLGCKQWCKEEGGGKITKSQWDCLYLFLGVSFLKSFTKDDDKCSNENETENLSALQTFWHAWKKNWYKNKLAPNMDDLYLCTSATINNKEKICNYSNTTTNIYFPKTADYITICKYC